MPCAVGELCYFQDHTPEAPDGQARNAGENAGAGFTVRAEK